MLIVVPPEPEGETRTACTPETVAELTGRGHEVVTGRPAEALLPSADLVLGVKPLARDLVETLRRGAVTCSFLDPGRRRADVERRRALGIVSLAMDQVPRIAAAQTMDALTSQSLIAGYRAAILAAERSPVMFGLQSTAAGPVGPARVVVLGAGVAGLEAIATCRRLGAAVWAYDVRASSAEEIASLGAEFLELGLDPVDGAAGYARELTPERTRTQLERLSPYVAAADVVITTAYVPGRAAPTLVTRAMLESMRAGAVVVDLAVGPDGSWAGNVEGAVEGLTRVGGVRVFGEVDAARQLPELATRLYARNVAAVIARYESSDDPASDPVLGPMLSPMLNPMSVADGASA